MTSTFVDYATTSLLATEDADIPIQMPATVQAGDYLVAMLGNVHVTIIDPTITPAGWTRLTGYIYYKVADGTEGGTTVGFHSVTAFFTGDQRVLLAAVLQYRFSEIPTLIASVGAVRNFGSSSPGADAVSGVYGDFLGAETETRVYGFIGASNDENFISAPIGGYTWANATDRSGVVSHAKGDGNLEDALSIITADKLDIFPFGQTQRVDLTVDGGGFYGVGGDLFGIRFVFSAPQECFVFRSSSSAEYTSYETDGALSPPTNHNIDATTTQFVIDKPAGVVEGDLLVLVLQPSYEASPNRQSSGQYLTFTGPGTWTTHLFSPSSILAWTAWKIAGPSEPSSYTVEIHNTFDATLVKAYGLLIMGAWISSAGTPTELDLADPSSINLNATGSQWASSFDSASPYPTTSSFAIVGSEALTTNALIVYLLGTRAGYENGDNTGLLPGSVPWASASFDTPITQHAQSHIEGLPTRVDGTQAPDLNISTLAINRSLALGSESVDSGPIPDRSASLTWQPTSAMHSEHAYIYRLVLLCGEELTPYWGINAFPL